jgi:serine/threonine-protein kinase
LDSEVAYWAARAENAKGDRQRTLAMDDLAVELDPQFGPAYYDKIEELLLAGGVDAGLAVADSCAAHLQNPMPCLLERNGIDMMMGNCRRLEETSRQLLLRDPSYHPLYWYLANAAYALGRPSEEVAALIRQEAGRAPAELQPGFEFLGLAALDVLSGDFDAMRRRAKEFEHAIASFPEARWHAAAALWNVSAALESGRTEEASAVVADYFHRKDAWQTEGRGDDLAISRDPTPFLLVAGRRVGWMTAADFETRRKAWVDTWAARGQADLQPFVWLHGYAAVAETPDDAARALTEMPKYAAPPPLSLFALGDASIGNTYMLAGQNGEALGWLQRAAASCRAVESPFLHTQAHLLLARLRANAGARDEACAAYHVVLARWGSARSRSVTAEAARKEADALGCPARQN